MTLERAENPIKSTRTSFRILAELADTGGASLPEITGRVDITKGAVFNHLATLQELGYVVKREDEYQLSLSFLHLSRAARRQTAMTDRIEKRVCELAETTGETAGYVVMEDDDVVVATSSALTVGDSPLVTEGDRLSPETSAAGKAIVSKLSDEELRRFHRAAGDERTLDELHDDVTTIRSQGISVSRGEAVPTRYSVASPVEAPDGTVGAVTVWGPRDRLKGKALEQDIAGLVLKAADDIKVDLRRVDG